MSKARPAQIVATARRASRRPWRRTLVAVLSVATAVGGSVVALGAVGAPEVSADVVTLSTTPSESESMTPSESMSTTPSEPMTVTASESTTVTASESMTVTASESMTVTESETTSAPPSQSTSAPPSDVTAPELDARFPASGATGVSVAISVRVTFSESVTGVDTGTFTLTGPAGGVAADVSGAGATWRLNPTDALDRDTTYTARLSGGGITDAAGNTFGGTQWSFTTEGARPDLRPRLVDRSPDDGDRGVSVDTDVTVTFNEPVVGVDDVTFTLQGPDGRVDSDVTGADRHWTLTPFDPLDRASRYTAKLSGVGIEDADGNVFDGSRWSFHTQGKSDTTRPRVISRSPDPDARGVSRRTDVTVTFSEDVRGVDEGTFRLVRTSTGDTVSAEVFRRGSADRWTLRPDARLRSHTRYTVRLDGGRFDIRDLADNALKDTDWSFVTRRTVRRDHAAPVVLRRQPTSGAVDVHRQARVRVVFSEPVRRVSPSTFRLVNAGTGSVVSAEIVRLPGARRWVLDPDVRLARATRYVAVLRGGAFGIRDRAGNALQTVRWSFRTRG